MTSFLFMVNISKNSPQIEILQMIVKFDDYGACPKTAKKGSWGESINKKGWIMASELGNGLPQGQGQANLHIGRLSKKVKIEKKRIQYKDKNKKPPQRVVYRLAQDKDTFNKAILLWFDYGLNMADFSFSAYGKRCKEIKKEFLRGFEVGFTHPDIEGMIAEEKQQKTNGGKTKK